MFGGRNRKWVKPSSSFQARVGRTSKDCCKNLIKMAIFYRQDPEIRVGFCPYVATMSAVIMCEQISPSVSCDSAHEFFSSGRSYSLNCPPGLEFGREHFYCTEVRAEFLHPALNFFSLDIMRMTLASDEPGKALLEQIHHI